MEYNFSDIDQIIIDKSYMRYITWIFLTSGNYVDIVARGKYKRFYCTCLQLDAYDENMTELTIDDLHYALKDKRIPIAFNFDP